MRSFKSFPKTKKLTLPMHYSKKLHKDNEYLNTLYEKGEIHVEHKFTIIETVKLQKAEKLWLPKQAREENDWLTQQSINQIFKSNN